MFRGWQYLVILDFQGLLLFLFSLHRSSPFFVSRCFSHRSAVFPWRQVVLPQFWLPRRDSTSSNTGGVGFVLFLLLFLCCIVSLAITGDFGRAFSIVVIVHFCRYNLPLWCSQFSPLQLTRPHPIASLFVLVPSLNFPRSSLSIKTGSLRFHFSFWSSSSRRRAPSIALLDAGRGEWFAWIQDGQRS